MERRRERKGIGGGERVGEAVGQRASPREWRNKGGRIFLLSFKYTKKFYKDWILNYNKILNKLPKYISSGFRTLNFRATELLSITIVVVLVKLGNQVTKRN